MKSLVKNLLISSSLLMALAACSEPAKEKEKIVVTANQNMDANDLANAGEQLMLPQSLHLANKVFEMALAKNPDNKKAQFYHTFLKRVMIFQGILTRIQPYVEKYGQPAVLAQRIKEIPKGPARQFLLQPKEGATLLQNATDIQALLLEYRKAAEDFRSFVIQNADMDLELYLNPYFYQDMVQQNVVDACEVKETDMTWEIICDSSDIETVKVNMADLLVLKQLAAADIIYATGATSYSFGSIDEIVKRSQTDSMSPQAISESLELTKDFGALMKTHGFSAIRNLGSDLGVGMKWAMKYQASLCKRDEYGRLIARRGFLARDICIDNDNANKSLQTLDGILAGIIQAPVQLNDGSTLTTSFNVMTLFDKPIANLHSVLPTAWTEQGKRPVAVPDVTFGGALPNGDANMLLEKAK